ncbi:MAG: undecaprenyl/decaprenyl-phosphate alpha-N-acetylglucosaminyl 1-phosphate transferase [Muribaculaceae bacterium]|nr:undecaprenyl/decaprenyl-phosphate alpha-N-acetylglucosaminyl 1-phosphate transferase [Muribaculaceae bacterium]
MESWMANILSVFLISVIVTGVLIPQILLIAFRKQLFDVPDERKIHQGVVPRLGGIAFVPAIFLSIAFVAGVNSMLYNSEVFEQLALEPQQLCFGLCTLMIMYLVGMADDLIGVRYRAKFYSQIISGVLIVMSGLLVDDLHGFFFLSQLPLPLAWGLTVFAFVLIVNAVNLIDGIDGLASGLCGIAFLFYGVVFYAIGEMIFSLIAFAALGTLAPFFYYNVFGEAKVGKKIFMGDTGALTTGTVFVSITQLTLPAI